MVKRISKLKTLMLATAFTASLMALGKTNVAYAADVIPTSMQLYSTSGTPVYATPDVFSNVVVYLDRFVSVRVTGVTENGFYQVDIGGTFYIPGPYMVSSIEAEKTEKQKALENLDKFSEAYVNQLLQMDAYENKSFALVDVTGDGIPEIIDGEGKEIYTYYDGRAVMIYYSQTPMKLYYSKKDNQLLGKYKWKGSDVWEVYQSDTSLLPWGQLKCISTDASAYKGNATEITKSYTNNESTRAGLYTTLKGMLIN